MNELNELFEQASEGKLPPDFDRWEILNDACWTVAHEAAKHGHLPAGFDRWDMSDAHGWTVADVVQHRIDALNTYEEMK